jgi:hypothetical protein
VDEEPEARFAPPPQASISLRARFFGEGMRLAGRHRGEGGDGNDGQALPVEDAFRRHGCTR